MSFIHLQRLRQRKAQERARARIQARHTREVVKTAAVEKPTITNKPGYVYPDHHTEDPNIFDWTYECSEWVDGMAELLAAMETDDARADVLETWSDRHNYRLTFSDLQAVLSAFKDEGKACEIGAKLRGQVPALSDEQKDVLREWYPDHWARLLG